MTVPEKAWLWQDGCHSPAYNMAVDEALLLAAAGLGRPLLRLYEWDRPAVSIGYVQHLAKVPQDRGEIVRRITGGGVVFHASQFTYTLVLPPEHPVYRDTQPVESYALLNGAVSAALALADFASEMTREEIPRWVDRASMVCFHTPTRYDLVSGQDKIAGAAQRRMREGFLHQGSIELVAPLDAPLLRRLLPQGFGDFLKFDFESWAPDAAFAARAESLRSEKYGSAAWNGLR
ncbi:MAG: hypothetical protein RL095_2449 [Verrucomicrobiota bacterium]|jgi:lipoate-protein ligase A